MDSNKLIDDLINGDRKALARSISLIENEHNNSDEFLQKLPYSEKKIIGITGPPGAGKSTLVDNIISEFVQQQKKVCVLCVDPSSPFTHGALLGDRIRINTWFNNKNVFIRSLASRGNTGGLSPKIIEITDVVKAADFDEIIIETVGAGQTETEIAALVDTTIVVLVPEAGDEIQVMKTGLMEIADIFVVNKADRPGADIFARNLNSMLHPAFHSKEFSKPVIQTIASEKKGIAELMKAISTHEKSNQTIDKKISLITERVYQLLLHKKMKSINKNKIIKQVHETYNSKAFNIYNLVDDLYNEI